MFSTQREAPFLWLLVLAAGLYAGVSTRFYVGSFGDDARDILAAQSLLHGSYVNLQIPAHPPLNFPLPGFPLVLVPFVALCSQAYGWLRIVPALFMLGSLVLLRKLFQPCFQSAKAFFFWIALVAFNPATLAYSTFVIADSCYLFFILWALLLLRKEGRTPTAAGVWGLSAILASAVMIRPEGALLAAAVALVLAYTGRWKSTFQVAALPTIALGLFLWRNLRLTGQASGYSTLWMEAFAFLRQGYVSWSSHLISLIKNVFIDLLLGVSLPSMRGGQILVAAMIGGLLFYAMARGFGSSLRLMAPQPSWLLALSVYAYAHILLHMAWPASDPHYLWPLLPFLLFLLLRGAPRSLVPLLALLYLWQAGFAMKSTFHSEPGERLPQNTLAWISAQTPLESCFLAPNAAVVALYSGRTGYALVRASGPEDFHNRLIQSGIHYVLVSPPRFLSIRASDGPSPEKGWGRIALTVSKAHTTYPLVYVNPAEQTKIYQVKVAEPFSDVIQ